MDQSSLLQLIDALQKGSNGGSNPLFDIIRKLMSGGGFNALSGGSNPGPSNPLASMFGAPTSEPMQNGGQMAANAFRGMLDPNNSPQQGGWQGNSPFNALGSPKPPPYAGQGWTSPLAYFGAGGGGIYPSGNQMQ